MPKNYKEWYLKGYEAGLKEAWSEVSSLATRGHTAKEIQMYVRSRKAAINQMLQKKALDIGREASFSTEEVSSVSSPPQQPKKENSEDSHSLPDLKRGYGYFVCEDRPEKAFSMLSKARDNGSACVMITRTPPDQLRDRYDVKNMRLVWLTKKAKVSHLVSGLGVPDDGEEEERVDPADLTRLSSFLISLLKENRENGGAILFDGIEYMVMQNEGFNTVMKFIQYINEAVSTNKGFLFLVVGEGMKQEHSNLLRKEMAVEVR